MSEQNKDVVRRFLDEVINGRRFDLLPELFAEDFVWHGGPFGETHGLEEFGAAVKPFIDAFPDLRMTVDDLFGEDDRVVARCTVHATHQGEFLGVPPTGKQVTWTGQPIYRVENGKIAEEWFIEDTFGLMQSLGASRRSAQQPERHVDKVVVPSTSVAALARQLASPDGVTGAEIVRKLVDTHSYADGLPPPVAATGKEAKVKPVEEWVKDAGDLYELPESDVLDGRRFIYALALLEGTSSCGCPATTSCTTSRTSSPRRA